MRLLSTTTLTCLVMLTTMTMGPSARGGEHKIVELRNFESGELACRAFQVKEPIDVDIYAIGSGFPGSRQLNGYAWIIRSGSLTPVWIMEQHNTDELEDNPELREYDSSLELEPGDYEVYFYAGSPFGPGNFNLQLDNVDDVYNLLMKLLNENLIKELQEAGKDLQDELKDLQGDLADVRDELKEQQEEQHQKQKEAEESYKKAIQDWEADARARQDIADRLIRDYELDISTDDDAYAKAECAYRSNRVAAEILKPGANLYSSVGFTCTKPLKLEVTAVGEYSEFDDAFVDHGWLLDAATRERIWSMDKRNTDYAGGDKKNREVQTTVSLPAGDYLLYYVTDDSHSWGDFNAAPPYNPQAYGIRVETLDKADLKYVKPYRDNYSESALIAITQVGDNECLQRYFKVLKPCDLRVYAIGEYDKSADDFCDYAWIEKSGLTHTFWNMTWANTQHAGGAAKNRSFDDVVHFDDGVYTVGFVTDGSHSFGAFNAAAPYDQKNYGVSLYAIPNGCNPDQVVEISRPEASGDVLAKMTCVGDDADVHEDFRLDKPTRVRIYALGEGEDNSMFDYGWLQRTGDDQIVWEMTYRKTRPAGGADKNRMVDDVVMLDAGSYQVWYRSDGSHSFGDWNAPKPRDPQSWGITILKADK